MRGQILGVDLKTGEGQIAGDDGTRYRFRPEDWSDKIGPAVGALVDFEAADKRAANVYRLPGTAVAAPAPARRTPRRERNKFVAALLAFCFGLFGVHRFYVGRTGSGIAMLVLTCTVIGIAATSIWALVDTVRYLMMSHGEFEDRYARCDA